MVSRKLASALLKTFNNCHRSITGFLQSLQLRFLADSILHLLFETGETKRTLFKYLVAWFRVEKETDNIGMWKCRICVIEFQAPPQYKSNLQRYSRNHPSSR